MPNKVVLRAAAAPDLHGFAAGGETAREKKLLVLADGQGSHRRVPSALSAQSFDETSQRRRQEHGVQQQYAGCRTAPAAWGQLGDQVCSGRSRRPVYQPTATRSHCGLAWEMKEDWPATSS